ncbi:MAG: response regulator transcription factor [Bacteriovoracaceae bacterium]
MPKILIVEDDFQIIKSLRINLKLSGFDSDSASTLAEAWKKLNDDFFDIMLLDIGLPDGSGLDFCQKVRESGDDIPILFLSARTDEATVVKGMTRGGDDYLRKPFGIEELKVRMNKIIKRFSTPTNTIIFGELIIDPAKRIVTIMDQIVTLGRKEMEILIILAKKAGDIVTRETILSSIYESADMYDRTVDSHMSHLRKKLREVAGNSLQINSVYGLGYRLEWK